MFRASYVFCQKSKTLPCKTTPKAIKDTVKSMTHEEAIKWQIMEYERVTRDPEVKALLQKATNEVKEKEKDPTRRLGQPIVKGWDSTFEKEKESRKYSPW